MFIMQIPDCLTLLTALCGKKIAVDPLLGEDVKPQKTYMESNHAFLQTNMFSMFSFQGGTSFDYLWFNLGIPFAWLHWSNLREMGGFETNNLFRYSEPIVSRQISLQKSLQMCKFIIFLSPRFAILDSLKDGKTRIKLQSPVDGSDHHFLRGAVGDPFFAIHLGNL